ncbi:transposase [Paraeggerthella sp.]|uniref:transposase n=1 Tax=Paraeggerthella sp. TaxID=2897350 RepID=UPI0035292027
MGKYAVPERIRAMKPKGTMVKAISGNYYVYEYRSVTVDGRRRTEMGRCIGSIKEGVGFVPNDGRARDGEVTTLEFGQYALALASSGGVLGLLREHFDPQDAAQVYALAVVNCVNGMQPAKDAGRHFAMSALSLRFPSLKMGPDALATLLDALGRRQGPAMSFEAALCASSGPEVAVDGHAMPLSSRLNDLAEPGCKRGRLGSDQVNLLMAYDVEGGRPLLSRFYEGAVLEKSGVRDLLSRAELAGRMFVVDAGFYSGANLEALSSNGCSYIIPLHRRLLACREAVADPEVDGRFVYRRDRRASAVEYRDARRRGARVVLFRDLNRQALEQAGYLAALERGAKGYTAERFEEVKDLMGVIVLQTSREDLSAQEVYEAYKRRWSVGTFFDWLKNGAGFASPGAQGYCRAQGLAFVALVTALVHRDLADACRAVKGKSVDDCLLEARMVKANKVGGRWVCCNLTSRQERLFAALKAPLSVDALLQHT